MSKKAFIFLLLFISGAPAFADVSIETSVSRSRLSVGDDLTLEIVISNADGKIIPPSISTIDGFSAYSQGRSQEISIINGITSSKNIFSYVLVANSSGKKKIGPFDILINSRPYKIPAIDVEVGADPGASVNAGYNQAVYSAPGASAPPQRALPSADVSNQDIFVKVWLDKDEVYVNESAMLTYTLYTRLSATYKGFEKEPVTTGFWVEDFPPDKTIKKTEQILNGSRYVVADVRKLALFPTEAGIFTIVPGVLSASVEVRGQEDFNNFFSSNVFGRRSPAFAPAFMSQIVPRTIPTESIKLTVKALPESGKPKDFSGAVGNYSIESSIDKAIAEEGTPITFKIKISGRGNINTIQTPALPPMDDIKMYDSSSSVNISKDELIVQGEKVTETVIVAKKSGAYEIPALSFVYFDPALQIYKEIKSKPRALTITPAPAGEYKDSQDLSSGVTPADKEEVKALSRDIRFIKLSQEQPFSWTRGIFKTSAYWPFNLLFFIFSIALMVLAGFKEKDDKDVSGTRSRRSHRLAKQKLKKAHDYLKVGKPEEFYAELSKAMHGYFSDRLDVPEKMVSMETIEERMETPDATFLKEVRSLFHDLATARFAKMDKNQEEMKKLYETADRLIVSFEKVRTK